MTAMLQARDLSDRRLDLIASAITFSLPKLYLEKMDVDISAMTLIQAKKKPLLNLTPLYHAVSEGNLDRVKKLTEEGENPYDQDINEDTILHYAAEMGKLDILKYFIDEYECIPTKEGWHGSTVLHSAAGAGQLSVVKYLTEQCQLDPSALEDDDSCSPLVYACRSGDIKTCCYLIEYMKETMSIDSIFKVQYYPKAQKEPLPDSVNAIEFQRGPLSSACFYGHLSLVKYLIEKYNCDFISLNGKVLIILFYVHYYILFT